MAGLFRIPSRVLGRKAAESVFCPDLNSRVADFREWTKSGVVSGLADCE